MFAPRLSRSRAFTLTELVVVIVVLLILMAIAVPAYLMTRDSASDTSTKSDVGVAHRTGVLYAANHDGYGPITDLLEFLGDSEPNMTFTDDPAVAEAGGAILVDLHDPHAGNPQTAHLCGVSPTGFAFCIAANRRGQLNIGPVVQSPTAYRTWGGDLDAARCHLPTETTEPGENCAEGASGGPGWQTAGNPSADAGPGGPGDIGAGDGPGSPADLAAIPTEGSPWRPANIPEVGARVAGDEPDHADVVRRIPEAYIGGTSTAGVDGVIGSGGSAAQVLRAVTDDAGDLIFIEAPLGGGPYLIRKLDVGTGALSTLAGGAPRPSDAPTDGIGGELSVGYNSAMAWGGGRVWIVDNGYGTNATARARQHFRVFNPRTGEIRTIASVAPPNNVQSVYQMAYVPSQGAIYWVYTRGSSKLWRMDVATGAVSDVSLPGYGNHLALAHDHTTDRLILIAETPARERRSLISVNPADGTHQVITGEGAGQGNWDQRPSAQFALPTELFKATDSTKIMITRAGGIVLSEAESAPNSGLGWSKSWVRVGCRLRSAADPRHQPRRQHLGEPEVRDAFGCDHRRGRAPV